MKKVEVKLRVVCIATRPYWTRPHQRDTKLTFLLHSKFEVYKYFKGDTSEDEEKKRKRKKMEVDIMAHKKSGCKRLMTSNVTPVLGEARGRVGGGDEIGQVRHAYILCRLVW